MASHLENEHCYINHSQGVYEQNNIVNSVHVVWSAEWAVIASNEMYWLFTHASKYIQPQTTNVELCQNYLISKKAEPT